MMDVDSVELLEQFQEFCSKPEKRLLYDKKWKF